MGLRSSKDERFFRVGGHIMRITSGTSKVHVGSPDLWKLSFNNHVGVKLCPCAPHGTTIPARNCNCQALNNALILGGSWGLGKYVNSEWG